MRLTRGDELGGQLRIDTPIGTGGMAEVWRVWNERLERWEALKVLLASAQDNPDLVERFLNDARIAAGLGHPNIIRVYSVSGANERPSYFTMELIEGGDLAMLMRRMGQVPLPEAQRLLRQVASALDYAHEQKVIHRDIKPGNILLTHEGDTRVTDFGIARAATAAPGKTQAGMVIGTPDYMSPEQANGLPASAASDQYSLALMAYELLTGTNPFRRSEEDSVITILIRHANEVPPNACTLNPSLPPSVGAALARGLAKNAHERFPSCQALVEALTVTTLQPPPPPPPSRTPWAWIGVGATAVAGLSLIGYGLSKNPAIVGAPTPSPSPIVADPTPEPLPDAPPTPEVTYEAYNSRVPPYRLEHPSTWKCGDVIRSGDEVGELWRSPDGKVTMLVQFTTDGRSGSALGNLQGMQRTSKSTTSLSEPHLDGEISGNPAAVWTYLKNGRAQENTCIWLQNNPAPHLASGMMEFKNSFVAANLVCSAPDESELNRWKPIFDHMKRTFRVRYDIQANPRPTPFIDLEKRPFGGSSTGSGRVTNTSGTDKADEFTDPAH